MEFNNLTEKEKGYLFGLFEGDGYKLYDEISRHYHVEFYLNSLRDRQIIEFVVGLLKKIGLKPNLYQDKRYNCKRVRVYCKDLFQILSKDIGLRGKTKEFSVGYVSGLIDSEGYVNREKSFIVVVNTKKEVLERCKKFLDSMSVGSKISERSLYKKDRTISYRMYVSVSFKSVSHLSIKTKSL